MLAQQKEKLKKKLLSERTRNALIKNEILYVEDLEKKKKGELLVMQFSFTIKTTLTYIINEGCSFDGGNGYRGKKRRKMCVYVKHSTWKKKYQHVYFRRKEEKPVKNEKNERKLFSFLFLHKYTANRIYTILAKKKSSFP